MHSRLPTESACRLLGLSRYGTTSSWPFSHCTPDTKAFDRLFSPSDLSEAASLFNVNCGPAAFAALTGRNILDIINLFPHYPARPWTNRTQMKTALENSNLSWAPVQNGLPENGVCLVQFTGPWSNYSYRLAQLRHSHWIAVKNNFVYDVNWEGWLPRQNWEEVVLDELMKARKRCNGWSLLAGYEVKCPPSDCYSERSGNNLFGCFQLPYAATSLNPLASFEST